MHSSAGIVDSSIALTPSAEGQAAAVCVRAESTLYISDTYLSGCAAAVVPSGRPPIPAAAGPAHTLISLLAMGRHGFNASQPYTYALPAYVDGARQDSVLRMEPSVSGPPANHESRHLWSEVRANQTLSSGWKIEPKALRWATGGRDVADGGRCVGAGSGGGRGRRDR